MINRRRLAPLLIPLVFGVSVLRAQTPPEPGSSEDPTPEASGSGPAGQEVAVPPSPTPETPAVAGGDSPFDYRSSEQISEDLSVSFPVDI